MAPRFAIDSQALLPWNEDTPLAYTSTRNSGDVAGTVAIYSRYELGVSEAAVSNGVFLKNDEVLTFALGALVDGTGTAFDPKPRDFATPSGKAARVVLEVAEYRMLRYWSLKVRDLILAYDLHDSATVSRPAPTAAATGMRTPALATLAAAVPCRLQPEETARELDTMAKSTSRKGYTAYLGQALALLAGDVITVSGVKYEVLEQSKIANFDTLASVACERLD
jgi:hypothetical protein